ncbi:MAG: flavin reductase [Brumimicrobium sp.]
MKKLNTADFDKLEKRYRSQLINSISGVKSGNLIGTKNIEGQTNLAVFNSVVHIGSDPALIAFIQRPTTVERHTYENIIATEKYTINAIHHEIIYQAHQTAARYMREESEFDETSLETEYLDDFFAPFVKGSPLQFSLKLEEEISIKTNDTKLIIGRVESLYFDEKLLEKDGSLSLDKGSINAILGLDTYLSIKKTAKLSYAKPDRPLKNLLK